MLVKRRPPRPAKKEHPTKRALIDTVVSMLDTTPVEEITCDAVLDASGISRGSLYYHFADFGDLVEHALAHRFATYVDQAIGCLDEVATLSTSASEFRSRFLALAHQTLGPEWAAVRFERVIPFAAAANSTRFRATLGMEQQRLTDAQAEFLRMGQERGWVHSAVNVQAASVFLQAVAMGRVIDDVTPVHMEQPHWDSLVTGFIDNVLLPR
jgi:AcrR family transcriptional regulator